MKRVSILVLVGALAVLGDPSRSRGEDAAADPDPRALRAAAVRGLAIVQKAAANYPKHRDCFSCHHQTLPMMAMIAAAGPGLEIDRELLQDQAEFTRASFESRIDDLKAGKGIGGRAMTVSYGLLAFELAGSKPDELTTAMVTFLLKTQDKDGHWTTQARRPPMEESPITSTVLSLLGLNRYASADQREEVEKAIDRGLAWVVQAPVESTEDRVMKLWFLNRFRTRIDAALGESAEKRDAARADLVRTQRDDGGWSQRDGMESDAYATGEAVATLRQAGMPASHPVIRRGVAFLLRTQDQDGSWFVATRSKPVQVFFDNGDPHGKSQFISIPATSWAVTALAAVMPHR